MLERLEWPLDRKPERQPQRIDLRSIRPVIHLAHRVAYPLVLPDRVIFDHEMVLVLQGEGELLTESSVHSFAPGDLLLIPPCSSVYRSSPGCSGSAWASHRPRT